MCASGEQQGAREFLVICAVIAVAAAVVFGLVTVVAFSSGPTPTLAGGGALLGWAGRDAERGRGMSWSAVVIGALALAGYLAVYLIDTLS